MNFLSRLFHVHHWHMLSREQLPTYWYYAKHYQSPYIVQRCCHCGALSRFPKP